VAGLHDTPHHLTPEAAEEETHQAASHLPALIAHPSRLVRTPQVVVVTEEAEDMAQAGTAMSLHQFTPDQWRIFQQNLREGSLNASPLEGS